MGLKCINLCARPVVGRRGRPRRLGAVALNPPPSGARLAHTQFERVVSVCRVGRVRLLGRSYPLAGSVVSACMGGGGRPRGVRPPLGRPRPPPPPRTHPLLAAAVAAGALGVCC